MAFMSILARLGLDSSGFQAGVKQAESAAKGLGKSLNSELKGQLAGAFSVAAVVAAGKAVVDYADKIGNMSDRLGISTDELQRFDYAARQSGSSLETFQGVFEKLSVAREEALEGNAEIVQSFARLGVAMDDLKNRRLDELIKIIARTVQAGDAQALLPALRTVGGGGAGELIPTFQAGLDETGAQAPIISAEDIEAMKQAGDNFSALVQTLQSDLAPVVSFVISRLQDLVDFLKLVGRFAASPIKAAASIVGSLAGGASFSEAVDQAPTFFSEGGDYDKSIDEYDERKRRENAAIEARRLKNEEAKQRKAEEENINALREAKKAADAKFLAEGGDFNLNELRERLRAAEAKMSEQAGDLSLDQLREQLQAAEARMGDQVDSFSLGRLKEKIELAEQNKQSVEDAKNKVANAERNRQAADQAAQNLSIAEANRMPVAGAEEAQRKAKAKIQALSEQVQDMEDKNLPEAERRLKLEEKILKLRARFMGAEANFLGAEAAGQDSTMENLAMLAAKKKLLDAEAQLKPEKPETEVAASFKVADPLVNSLERIGFSFGKSAQPAGENFLKEIAKNTKDTAKFGAQSALASTQTAGALT